MNLYKSTISRLIALSVCMFSSVSLFAEMPKARFISSFPFQLVNGGFIVIEAKLPGVNGSLHFMLDTGSSGVSLDSSTAVSLDLMPQQTDNLLRGLGDIRAVKFLYDKTLLLPNITLQNLNFHINDYGFFYEAYGTAIDGVIGFPLFKDYIVKVDYVARQIELWRPGSISYPSAGYTFYPSINGAPFIDASIRENRKLDGNYLFDTGADICVLLSDKYVADSTVIAEGKKSINIVAAGIGGKQRMKLTTLEQMEFGPFNFKKVPSLIYEDPVNITRYPSSVGIIGIEFLRRFNIVFNYPAGEIHLTPNQNFKERFHYGYTGFDLQKHDNHIVVGNIAKDSPAERAGLQQNDIVLGIKNTYTNQIEDYKKVVSSASKKVVMHVLRGSLVTDIVVEVDSVL